MLAERLPNPRYGEAFLTDVMNPSASPVDPRTGAVDKELQLGLFTLYVDKVAVATTREFAARGITSILLKGPAIARWLYRDGTPRPYGDADLLVSPADWIAAQTVLSELGFTRELASLDHPGMASFASEAWVRGGQNVDLHCTLWGLGADPKDVWAALSRTTDTLELQGAQMTTLAPEARALLLATHAASHGDGWAVTDLARGIRMLPLELWRGAGALAVELDAGPAFVAGMRLVPGGQRLVRQIGLPDTPLAEASLRAWRVPMALGLEQLSQTPGTGAKASVVWHELFPTPAFMRWWSPLARRGRRGLGAAYVWRLLWAVRYAVPAVRAWRRARRAGEGFSRTPDR